MNGHERISDWTGISVTRVTCEERRAPYWLRLSLTSFVAMASEDTRLHRVSG